MSLIQGLFDDVYINMKEVGNAMKKGLLILLILSLSFLLLCCSQEQTVKKEALAKINDYVLTLKEFEDQLAAELEFDKDFKLTKKAKQEFLDQIIQKELLIQEAKKLQMDTRKKFIMTIERYWKSTLIRDLMESKGNEFSQRTYVSQEEIENRYEEIKKFDSELPPFEQIQNKIAKELKEKKKRKKLKEWVDSLRKNARIDINDELLYKN